ncbi:MAG: hypothetical protein GX022_04640 [Clostridiaceae bacterium]|nr:hypothetical protein [Clostridiaceae bacterium]
MNDKLKEIIKDESNRFFSDFNNQKMSNAVFYRIRNHHKKSRRKLAKSDIGFNYAVVSRISVILACFVLLITSAFLLRNKALYENDKNEMIGEPVSQQRINFSDSGFEDNWITFFKINKPDKVPQNNLLAVLWETGKNGDYQMAYSSMFENSSKPELVRIIDFDNEQPSMMVISTKNPEKQFIHYRVIGYSDSKIIAFMEQDYVTGGEISIIDGVIKETRLMPDAGLDKNSDGHLHKVVTYYIPYQINKTGDIFTTVQNLIINKGDYIAVMGNENTPVETLNSDLLIDWKPENELINYNMNTKYFRTENAGQEEIYIRPLNSSGQGRKISVLIQ